MLYVEPYDEGGIPKTFAVRVKRILNLQYLKMAIMQIQTHLCINVDVRQ